MPVIDTDKRVGIFEQQEWRSRQHFEKNQSTHRTWPEPCAADWTWCLVQKKAPRQFRPSSCRLQPFCSVDSASDSTAMVQSKSRSELFMADDKRPLGALFPRQPQRVNKPIATSLPFSFARRRLRAPSNLEGLDSLRWANSKILPRCPRKAKASRNLMAGI